jgi:hypothetical protein
MVDSAPNFNLQPNFPVSTVIDAAQRKNVYEQQFQQQQHQNLMQGITDIGAAANSLVSKRMQVAQALAQANLYKHMHPELFAPTTTTTTEQAPVMRNQTAAYDPVTGSVTPNSGLSGIGAVIPRTQTTTTPPLINDQMAQSLPTALLGLSPKDLIDSYAQGQAAKTQQGELDLKRQYEPQRLAIEAEKAKNDSALRNILAGIQGFSAKSEATHRTNEEITDLLSKKSEHEKNLSSGVLGGLYKSEKALQAEKAIKEIDAELARRGYNQQNTSTSNGLPGVGQTVNHPSGVKITRIK